MNLKPIETYYNGYRFRSRLEARVAVFLEELGVKYYYELDGYKLSDGTMYLPDFYLPDQDMYLEVKGVMTDKDMHKIRQLWKDSGKGVVVIDSDWNITLFDTPDRDWVGDGLECRISKCEKCGKVVFWAEENSWRCNICGAYDGHRHLHSTNDRWALQYARYVRFENGERA